MDFDPRLSQLHLGRWQASAEAGAVVDGYRGHKLPILGMDMRPLVLLIIVEVVHQDQDAVEHRDGGHGNLLFC